MKTFLLLLLVLVSCSSGGESIADTSGDIPDNNDNGNAIVRILKIEEYTPTTSLPNSTMEFTYNSDNFVVQIKWQTVGEDFADISDYSYDNGQIVQTFNYHQDNNTNVISNEYINEFTYTNDLLTRGTDNGVINHYTYNANSYLATKQASNGYVKTYFYDSQNNVTKIIREGESSTNETNYEYNDYLNYYRLLIPDSFFKTFRLSDYNVTKRVSSGNETNYEYTYASNGYPATIIEKEDGVLVNQQTIYYE